MSEMLPNLEGGAAGGDGKDGEVRPVEAVPVVPEIRLLHDDEKLTWPVFTVLLPKPGDPPFAIGEVVTVKVHRRGFPARLTERKVVHFDGITNDFARAEMDRVPLRTTSLTPPAGRPHLLPAKRADLYRRLLADYGAKALSGPLVILTFERVDS